MELSFQKKTIKQKIDGANHGHPLVSQKLHLPCKFQCIPHLHQKKENIEKMERPFKRLGIP